MSQFHWRGDNNAANTGFGTQNVTYNSYGGAWSQITAVVIVVVGLVIGISMQPQGSDAQHSWYVVILSGCASLCALCLWSICGRVAKSRGRVGVLTLCVIMCTTFSVLCYQQLAAHGDVSVSVDVREGGKLANRAEVWATVDATAARSHLKLRAELPDHYAPGMCSWNSEVIISPVVNGVSQRTDEIRLGNGEMGDMALRGAQGQVRLRVKVETGKNCLLDLRFVDAVLYDKGGWFV